MTHAIRASTRGLGTANEEHDDGVAQSIFDKCWPVIRDAWRWERDSLATEYLKLGSEVVHTPLIIYYQPTAPQPGEKITSEAVSADKKLAERLERMRQIIRILYGPGSGIAANYYWEPTGEAVTDRDWQRTVSFSEPGKYPVKVRLEVAPFTSFAQTEPRVMLRREVPALVEVEVGGKKPPTGPGINLVAEEKVPMKLYADFKSGVNSIQTCEVTLSKRSSVILQAAGMKANDFYTMGRSPSWYAWYDLVKGVPCHLELSYTAAVAPTSGTVSLPDDVYQCKCAITVAQPRFVMVIAHYVPGKPVDEKEVPGATYKLDFTPKVGENYSVRTYALIDYTASYTGIDHQPRTEKSQERIEVGFMCVDCPQ
jgi:hypothetical protein